MPRAARCVFAGVPLHIVQRGISRNACFFREADYVLYLRQLFVFSRRFACTVHAYCLMTNHVHLLVTPRTAEACARMMKMVGQSYVQAINQRLARSGTLWEGRFKSCLVQSEHYVLCCYRYIELNPVRAGMVPVPGDYRWSSYRSNAMGESDDLVQPHPAFEALASSATERILAYRELCRSALSPITLEAIRTATRLGGIAGSIRKRRGRPAADEKNRVCP